MHVVSILVALALMVSLLTISTSAAEEMRSWKLMKTLTLLPYKGFGSTTLSHFNEAFWQWNKECSTYSLQHVKHRSSKRIHKFEPYTAAFKWSGL